MRDQPQEPSQIVVGIRQGLREFLELLSRVTTKLLMSPPRRELSFSTMPLTRYLHAPLLFKSGRASHAKW